MKVLVPGVKVNERKKRSVSNCDAEIAEPRAGGGYTSTCSYFCPDRILGKKLTMCSTTGWFKY